MKKNGFQFLIDANGNKTAVLIDLKKHRRLWYVNFEEMETGSIEVGKAADLIVLDRNLFEIPAYTIHRAKVLLTLLEGKEVFRDSSIEIKSQD